MTSCGSQYGISSFQGGDILVIQLVRVSTTATEQYVAVICKTLARRCLRLIILNIAGGAVANYLGYQCILRCFGVEDPLRLLIQNLKVHQASPDSSDSPCSSGYDL